MTQSIQPPMTDERLDRLVRELLTERAEDVAAAAVSADAIAVRIASRLRPSPSGRAWVLLAAATILATLVIGGALAVGGAFRLPSLPVPAPSTPDHVPSLPEAPSMPPGEVVHGWPDTNENPPGVYSWDGSRCGGSSCVMGFMHNGYGSGDVEIRLDVVPDGTISDDGATAVTLAGHDGIYRQSIGREEWIVDIQGTTIAIRLTAQPGTSEADLADAHAIIGSMRYERQDNDLGFRLVFTLTTDQWDSG
jgi:hypothetical protein